MVMVVFGTVQIELLLIFLLVTEVSTFLLQVLVFLLVGFGCGQG